MSALSITKTYQDNTLLSASDLDAILDSVETFLNTTKLDSDNIQNASITANSKFKTASITDAVIAADAVVTNILADGAVTTTKILDAAVTTAKMKDNEIKLEKLSVTTSGALFVGSVIKFHTYNGLLSIPRGFVKCDGSLIDQTTYDAQHGSGTYVTDGVATGGLLGKYTPNMVSKYAIGSLTTSQTGASAIASEGNAGNTANFTHTHTLDDHTHTLPTVFTSTQNPGGLLTPNGYLIDRTSTSTTTSKSVANGLTTALDIRPESIEFIYIIKVV